jgi:O-succinylbenzoic acid--CoA ligase
MTTTLTINARTFDPRELLAGIPEPALGDNARAALDFCQRWLAGQEEFVVHTSGSTGAPKPIVLRRAQMEASARATGAALGLAAGMAALVCLPVRYIAGQMMLARGLTLGLAMTLVEPASDPLAGLPASARFDFTAVVPLQLQTLLDGPAGYAQRLNRVQAILVGGAPLSAALEQRAQSVTAPLYHTYGMTETATHIALRRINGPDASPWFHPLPGVAIDIDPRGCLRINGPMTLGHWLQTNDLVALSSPPHPPPTALRPPFAADRSPFTDHRSPITVHPSFRWLGRWDNVINSGGVKVQVERVEAAVEQAWLALGLAERRSFVAGLPDERLGQMVALVIEGEALLPAQETALRAALAHLLPVYEAPRQVVYTPHFAETATGKIDRGANLERLRR